MRLVHLLLMAVAALALMGIALALTAGHGRAAFLAPAGQPSSPVARHAPWPAWAHQAPRASTAPTASPGDGRLAAPVERTRGSAPAVADDAAAPRTPSAPPFAWSRRAPSTLRLSSVMPRIPAPPPRPA